MKAPDSKRRYYAIGSSGAVRDEPSMVSRGAGLPPFRLRGEPHLNQQNGICCLSQTSFTPLNLPGHTSNKCLRLALQDFQRSRPSIEHHVVEPFQGEFIA